MGLGNTNQGFSGGGGAGGTSCIDSIGLSMPSAFNVCNSPLTCSGTINVCGAGLVSQYIRGDGTLADFPNSTGGGASVNYYLNGSVNQGTFGGDVYYQMSKTALTGAGVDFTRTDAQGNGYIASFITDVGDPSFLNIPSGNWNLEFYFNSSSSGGSPSFYGELYKVSSSNVFTLIASNSITPEVITNGTRVDQYFTSISVPQTTLLITDRLAIRIYVTTSGRDITFHTENNTLSEVLTTFTTGITALNGLTEQVQFFSVGTCGTDFCINSCCGTHTFNLPTASCSARGAISAADYCSFSQKVMVADSGCCSTVRCGVGNCAAGDYSFVGGGNSNISCPSSPYSFIGAGSLNLITSGYSGVVAGASNNASGTRSFIGAGDHNITYYINSAVVSGGYNTTGFNARYSFIGAGVFNNNDAAYSSILGGDTNTITSTGRCSSISGGYKNVVSAPYSGASGLCLNACVAATFYSNNFCACGSVYSSALTCGCAVCVGTNGQLVGFSSSAAPIMVLDSGCCSTVRCGVGNCASSAYSFAGGGCSNNISTSCFSSILGGSSNSIVGGSNQTIGGGYLNSTNGAFDFIGGGDNNYTQNFSSGVASGSRNKACSNYSFVGGGITGTVSSAYSSILGGESNVICISSTHSSIIGGRYNTVSAPFSSASGCCLNACVASTFYSNNFCACGSLYSSALTSSCAVCVSTNGQLVGYTPSVPSAAIMVLGTGICSTVRCGVGNCASGANSFVAGTINTASGNYSLVVGGTFNTVTALFSNILGGYTNTVCSSDSSIVGGNYNTIQSFSPYSTISGGYLNNVTSCYGFIGGGLCNNVSAPFSGASGCCLNACVASTFYSNNFCACGSVYSSALTASCAVCVSTNGQLVGYTPTVSTAPIIVLGSGCCSTLRCGVGNCASGDYSFASSGFGNTASGSYSIVNGYLSCATSVYSTVLNGSCNLSSETLSLIGTGALNIACGSYSTVINGCLNTSSGYNSTVINGVCNSSTTCNSFVGTGYKNTASNFYSAILSGNCNVASGDYSFIGNGLCNTVSGSFSGAVGCCLNACVASTFYSNNFCACGSVYSSALTASCAVCVSTNGQLVGYTPTSGGITGSGTCNFVVKFTGSCSVGNSLIYDNGTSVGINTTTPSASYKLDVNGTARVSSTLNLGSFINLTTANAFGLNYLTFQANTAGNGVSASFLPNGNPSGYGYNLQFSTSTTSSNNSSLLIIGGNSLAGTGATNKHVIAVDNAAVTSRPLVFKVAPTNTGWGSTNEQLTLFGTGNLVLQNSAATATDAGYRLDVNGTSILNGQSTLTGSVTASAALARGIIATPTLVAAANNDVLVGLDISPTFTNGAFTGLTNYGLRVMNGGTYLYTSTVGATVLTVQGSTGQLFTVSDITTGNVFQVNDVSGLPLFAVNANGSYYSYTKSLTAIAATTVAYSLDKTTGTAAYFDYRITNTTNSGWRAGTVMVVWDGTNVEFTDTSTNDITATTSGLSWTAAISGSNLNLTATITSGTWNIKIGSRVI